MSLRPRKSSFHCRETNDRGSQASTAKRPLNTNACERRDKFPTTDMQGRAATTTELTLTETTGHAKIARMPLRVPRLANMGGARQGRTAPRRLGPHPKDAARQACKADLPEVRLRRRPALRTRQRSMAWTSSKIELDLIGSATKLAVDTRYKVRA